MLTILLTFTQKVTAYAPLLENETATMVNCPMMSMGHHETQMEGHENNCAHHSDMSHKTGCQSDCKFMTVVSVLHFIEHEYSVSQSYLLMTYQKSHVDTPYYFPESLYRPPLVS